MSIFAIGLIFVASMLHLANAQQDGGASDIVGGFFSLCFIALMIYSCYRCCCRNSQQNVVIVNQVAPPPPPAYVQFV